MFRQLLVIFLKFLGFNNSLNRQLLRPNLKSRPSNTIKGNKAPVFQIDILQFNSQKNKKQKFVNVT